MTFTKRPQDTAKSQHNFHNPVIYLDGSSMLRPQRPTKSVIGFAAVVVVVALILSSSMAYKAIDKILHGEENRISQIEQLLHRDVTLHLPHLTDLIHMDDTSLLQFLNDNGYRFIDLDTLAAEAQNIEYVDNPGVDVVCTPSDVDPDKTKAVYAKGINGADALTVAQYYNTSWHLINDIDNAVLSVKYTDFVSTTPEEALDTAMETQGWLENEHVIVEDEGVDEADNMYRSGTVHTDTGDFSWRISTCLFSAAYDVSDLPETTHYVGIRIYPL